MEGLTGAEDSEGSEIRPLGPGENEMVARHTNAVIIAALRRDPELPPLPDDTTLLLWIIRELAFQITHRYDELGALCGMNPDESREYALRLAERQKTDLSLIAMNDGQMPPPAPPAPGEI